MAEEKLGYWGKRTATIDWCESNYEVTSFIAEFWNTISNLVMILFDLLSALSAARWHRFMDVSHDATVSDAAIRRVAHALLRRVHDLRKL